MDLIFKHTQEKKDRNNSGLSVCNLMLYANNAHIEFHSTFELDYNRYGSKKHINFQHYFILSLENGDITTTYKIINDNLTQDKMFRNCTIKKNNDFKLFFDLTENGFYRGEKRSSYWGVKYQRCLNKIVTTIYDIISQKFNSKYYIGKNYLEKPVMNSLFDMIVDYHLDKKNIKPHNNVYNDIQYDYPKKKFLIKNDNKFLPSVLDYYGIKSKYLISELNKISDRTIHLSTLNYICKLFGSNYIDYIRQINWANHCFEMAPNKKTHELKNDAEKNCLVSVINKWEKETVRTDSFVYTINKLLSTREMLEKKGVELKFNAKNDMQFENLIEIWSGIKLHLSRGFKVKYDYPLNFLNHVEKQIILGDQIFNVKVLQSEEDFRIEGFIMKNCMGKQFPHGAIYTYISMQNKKKRINLQYRKGKLVQSFGKSNTPVTENFEAAVDVLNKKLMEYSDIEWKKVKYDFINNS